MRNTSGEGLEKVKNEKQASEVTVQQTSVNKPISYTTGVILLGCIGVLCFVIGVGVHELFGLAGSAFVISAFVLAVRTVGSKLRRSTIYTVSTVLIAYFAVLSMFLAVHFHTIFSTGLFLIMLVAFLLGLMTFAVILCSGEILKIFGIAKLFLLLLSAFVVIKTFNYTTEQIRYKSGPAYISDQLVKLWKSIEAYSDDHDGYLPTAEKWCDLLIDYDKSLSKKDFKTLSYGDQHWECIFAFNKNLDGLRLADVPNNVVALFEAYGKWNQTGGTEEMMKGDNEFGIYRQVLLVDGTIYRYNLREERVEKFDPNLMEMIVVPPLRWKP